MAAVNAPRCQGDDDLLDGSLAVLHVGRRAGGRGHVDLGVQGGDQRRH